MKIELTQVEYLAQCLANNSKYIISVSYHYHDADLLLQCLRTYERKGASTKFSKSIFKDNKPGGKKALYKNMLPSQNSYLHHPQI